MGAGLKMKAGGQHSLQLLQRLVLGALCGVGLLWIVNAAWPAGHHFIHMAAHGVQRLSQENPPLLLGATLGAAATLAWEALRR